MLIFDRSCNSSGNLLANASIHLGYTLPHKIYIRSLNKAQDFENFQVGLKVIWLSFL